jgi:hypothetical protein
MRYRELRQIQRRRDKRSLGGYGAYRHPHTGLGSYRRKFVRVKAHHRRHHITGRRHKVRAHYRRRH